ncbi:hypothetical protein C8Q74DRAFT_965327 [Fomes fomentarius]|nr:hypothetical protein C8Q74DRAFT_965327 [Fomes fomentarius]
MRYLVCLTPPHRSSQCTMVQPDPKSVTVGSSPTCGLPGCHLHDIKRPKPQNVVSYTEGHQVGKRVPPYEVRRRHPPNHIAVVDV